ncbi:cbb3-type cytochrome oxidase assembly protein CcoS [Thiothrix nivea]|uniref:Cytochrome oxidase maturation protein, cbb3-type n=1 Tax=Thiothrix nivea (strain ATCC 35100 / DSM 5205 / JP2) TaxID=870187 RepID=A0A656HAX9_THINJ|nr:cbb3-type cytochrome oxidase assembly protein CcoS [Thiothrix nivea]EIJ33232.1 cytochrome oxidase maturation protein, cbb3-type [Thiothrix nivea DSM 5205]
MEALYLLIPIAVGVMVIVVVAFIYSVKSGQYDDLEGPAHRILMDDDDPRIPGRQVKQPEKKAAVNPSEEKNG